MVVVGGGVKVGVCAAVAAALLPCAEQTKQTRSLESDGPGRSCCFAAEGACGAAAGAEWNNKLR